MLAYPYVLQVSTVSFFWELCKLLWVCIQSPSRWLISTFPICLQWHLTWDNAKFWQPLLSCLPKSHRCGSMSANHAVYIQVADIHQGSCYSKLGHRWLYNQCRFMKTFQPLLTNFKDVRASSCRFKFYELGGLAQSRVGSSTRVRRN